VSVARKAGLSALRGVTNTRLGRGVVAKTPAGKRYLKERAIAQMRALKSGAERKKALDEIRELKNEQVTFELYLRALEEAKERLALGEQKISWETTPAGKEVIKRITNEVMASRADFAQRRKTFGRDASSSSSAERPSKFEDILIGVGKDSLASKRARLKIFTTEEEQARKGFDLTRSRNNSDLLQGVVKMGQSMKREDIRAKWFQSKNRKKN